MTASRCSGKGGYDVIIAEPYLTDLVHLTNKWTLADNRLVGLECRHFFAGAAAYKDGSIVASLTPVGLAFKVPNEVGQNLLQSGRAGELRYFPNAPIKRGYVLFESDTAVSASDAALLVLGYAPTSE
ncbi:MAG: hypothetical protein QNL12_07445 [Acidimicrobiia bacterium]|nr:hypothetical protein [Acidimicrobiia bacterium]MDX2467130.1 hypothetical protein [Acidimicrobiia bacterium]